jgi:hypothetical protein
MSAPEGDSLFCFPESLNVSFDEVEVGAGNNFSLVAGYIAFIWSHVATNQPIMFGVHPSYITTRIKTKPDTF